MERNHRDGEYNNDDLNKLICVTGNDLDGVPRVLLMEDMSESVNMSEDTSRHEYCPYHQHCNLVSYLTKSVQQNTETMITLNP